MQEQGRSPRRPAQQSSSGAAKHSKQAHYNITHVEADDHLQHLCALLVILDQFEGDNGALTPRQTISSEPSRLDIRGYAGFEDVGGFSAQTIASDGDRIEVLLLMDEPAFPGPAVIGKVIKTAELMRSDGQQCAQSSRTSHD